MSFHHITFEYDDTESYEFNMISWMQLVNEERFFYNEPAITVQEAKKSFLIMYGYKQDYRSDNGFIQKMDTQCS
jgi:hypothetical protein